MNEKELKEERRERALRNLVKEAVVNVLAEQAMMQPQQAQVQGQSAVPPATPGPNAETNPTDPDIAAPQQQDVQFSVDGMVDKLNVLRGGRSFTDPEVFGRLTTFFNNLTDEQRNSTDWLLTELGMVVIDASEEQVDPQNQQQTQQTQPPQPPPQPQGQQQQGGGPGAPVMPSGGGM